VAQSKKIPTFVSMFRHKTLIVLFSFSICIISHAQKDYAHKSDSLGLLTPNDPKSYARKVVDTLASPYMAGRGYIDDGDKKAAKYISSQMSQFGLLHFGNSYEQQLSFNVNTFPEKIEVSVIRTNAGMNISMKQEPGADYIVLPNSCTMKGTFVVKRITKNTLSDKAKIYEFTHQDLKKTFLLIDDTNMTDKTQRAFVESMRYNPFKAKGVIILCKKLTEETSDSVADYVLIDALYNSKFDSANSVSVDIKNKFVKNYTSQNLIGYIKGTVQPDSFIVFSAHYDHLGRMGTIFFPGANDNASGTAMLLSLARYYSAHPENLRYSVVFIAFTGEEMGLFGSHYYVQHPLFPLSKIRFEVNMDIMGTGDEGITVVNAPTYDGAFHDLQRINDSLHLLKLIKPRGPTSNSDHYFFYANHVPDFFIYTMGGLKAYHDIYDRRETLPLTNFDDAFHLLQQFTNDICNRRF
jgi:aminopeptidase YwaD